MFWNLDGRKGFLVNCTRTNSPRYSERGAAKAGQRRWDIFVAVVHAALQRGGTKKHENWKRYFAAQVARQGCSGTRPVMLQARKARKKSKWRDSPAGQMVVFS